jgi:hypothetical protein
MNTEPMHELCLAGIVALSVILPLMPVAWAPKNAPGPKPWLRTIWTGQILGSLGAVLVIWSPLHPFYGLGLAAAGCVIFGKRLHCQLRPPQAGERDS